ncbi:MAG: hypothetical protein JSR47_08830 [Proteobacteria bacterium]|nr:hypothetical protein [Pseudomonadota bacterium]MBS0548152.1 hypothetical protein [Pseudomonadota bacterium]
MLKPAVLFVLGLALVGILSLALQSWSISRDRYHIESRAADKARGTVEMSRGVGTGG